MDDRQVHARYSGMEIVRYDRSGKWYLEPTSVGLKRQHVSINKAVASAMWGKMNDTRARVYLGLPGGRAFDAKVRKW